jgi:hypothetical protein
MLYSSVLPALLLIRTIRLRAGNLASIFIPTCRSSL